MAENIVYGMGQLRYNEQTPYLNNLNFNAVKKNVSMSTNNNGLYYQDILLSSPNSSFTFSYGTSYLLHLEIPKDLSYNAVYKIKLIKESKDAVLSSALRDYQIIKYIEIPKDLKTSLPNSRVILYPVQPNAQTTPWNGSGNYVTKLAIAKTLKDNPANNDIVYDADTGQYYIYTKTTNTTNPYANSKLITNKNDQIMNHTWDKNNVSSEIVSYDIVFSPRTSDVNYSHIWIELLRENDDKDIYFDGVYGRRINFNNFSAKVYSFTNLISLDYMRQIPIEHMGIYSHPNLIMAINGEEIRIGQSGYYELNDFEVTSLGIAAHGNQDRFTLDYQYKKTN